MTDRATSWSITINNPVASDYECIALARQKSGWRIDGEPEVGKEGTPHLQLWCTTPQVRFSAMKKAFPRAHIEIARNITALKKYCAKDGTALPSNDDKYPSLSKFWELLCDLPSQCTNEELMAYPREKRNLIHYDKKVSVLIEQGYHCESLAMNPSTRSIWNTYSVAIRKRTETEKTDRQALLLSQQADIPVANAPEEPPPSPRTEGSASSCAQDEDDEEFDESEYSEV